MQNDDRPVQRKISSEATSNTAQLMAQVNDVRNSSLFDATYYLSTYPDVAPLTADPILHYCEHGWREGRNPSSVFDTKFYLIANGDVKDEGINPFWHYVKFGRDEGRQTQSRDGQAVADAHDIRNSGLFDASYYLATYQDVSPLPSDPILHYCEHGWREGRNPSRIFDTNFYLSTNSDVKDEGINPFCHYVKFGRNEERQTQSATGSGAHLIAAFSSHERALKEAEVIRGSGLFDSSYYIAMYRDIQPPPADPIYHYCERGWREGRNPSDEFSTDFYRTAYPDIGKSAINPFWHYLVAGRAESRQVNHSGEARYEDDAYFGLSDGDIQLIAYYATSTEGAVHEHSRKGMRQSAVPHPDLATDPDDDHAKLLKQASIARNHGLSAWCFPVESSQDFSQENALGVFIENYDVDMGFILDISLCSVRFDHKLFEVIEAALADERYLTIEGRSILVLTLPSDDALSVEALASFYAMLAADRVDQLYLIMRRDGSLYQTTDVFDEYRFDAILDFPISRVPGETGVFKPLNKNGVDSVPYSIIVSQAIERIEISRERDIACYQAVTLGHDDTQINSERPLRYTRCQQSEYRRWLDAAIEHTRSHHDMGRRLLFLNSWNDWQRRAVLEPDQTAGYAKLNETSRALLGLPEAQALPKVSIIVPNYNHSSYLRRRLDSIYRQTYKNIEVLLLDDCSTDSSREMLLEYADRYPNLTKTFFNQKNSGGVFRQWAKGIKAASGDLIWIAESDDYCDINFLEELVRCFDDEAVMLANAKVEFVRSDETVIPNEFERHFKDLGCRSKWKWSYVNTAHQEVTEALGIINTVVNASAAIFRRPIDMSLLDDETWLSMRVVGDWIFYLHQIRGGKIAYSVDTVSYFRRHEESTAASSYTQEYFYRELGLAAQTVNRLYDVPFSVLNQCRDKCRWYFQINGGTSDDEFSAWFDEGRVLQAKHHRSPNIIVSTHGFYPGGAEILPIRMANEFKKQGHSVLLLSCAHGSREDGIRRLLRKDVPVIETSDIEATKDLLDDFGIEALNSHQWHVQKYPTQVPDVFQNLKAHVASLHGMIEYGDAFGVTLEQLRSAHGNVSTWVYTADKNIGPFIEHCLFEENSSRFVKLPNGMEPPVISPIKRSEIGIPQDAFVLCCVSRAIPEKGWTETIQAVAQAREISGQDIRLILVGNGPVYDDYCANGAPSFVYLAGFSENSVGFYAAADMGIMLTKFRSESFPLTIVDCMFADRPYIATAVGEIRDMLSTEQGYAGEVIELQDWEVPVDEVVRAIVKYATESTALQSAKNRVTEIADRYKIDVIAKQYVAIFEDTIRKHRGT